MELPAAWKAEVVGWVLRQMQRLFDVAGTGEHVARLAAVRVGRTRPAESAGPRSSTSARPTPGTT